MNVRAQTLRTILAVSVLLTAFWVVGLIWDAVFQVDVPVLILLIIAVSIAAVVCGFAFRGGRLQLSGQVELATVVSIFVPRLLAVYLVSVPVVGAVMWILITGFVKKSGQSDADIAILLMSIWLPLWFAPAVAIEWTWRLMQKRAMA